MSMKDELIDITKLEMMAEEIGLFEAQGFHPDDMTFDWMIEEVDSSIIITLEAYQNGNYVTSKSRKIQLLEE